MYDAARAGHLDILQYLVEEKGADLVHATCNDGSTPLSFACSRGHLACVKYLVSVGADPEAKNNNGKTARDIAGALQYPGIVAWLDEVVRARKQARKRWRVAGQSVAAALALYERAAKRVNAPGGVGYEEARAEFEDASRDAAKSGAVLQHAIRCDSV